MKPNITKEQIHKAVASSTAIETEHDTEYWLGKLKGKDMIQEIKDLPHAYKCGNNPHSPEANYWCAHCDLILQGEEVGYVAAGTEYANGEHAPCPQCGEENGVDRGDEEYD